MNEYMVEDFTEMLKRRIKATIERETYEAIKGFYYEAFIEYVKSEWEVNDFAIDIICNIIHYALEYECVSRDQFANFVADMIPEMEFAEVAAFCEDGHLTVYGKSEKERFWRE